MTLATVASPRNPNFFFYNSTATGTTFSYRQLVYRDNKWIIFCSKTRKLFLESKTVVYRFCKLEDDFGTAEEREITVLSDDQLSNTTPEKPWKIVINIAPNYVWRLCVAQFIAGFVLLIKKVKNPKLKRQRKNRKGMAIQINLIRIQTQLKAKWTKF